MRTYGNRVPDVSLRCVSILFVKPHAPNPSDRLVPQPKAHAFLVESAKVGRRMEVDRARAFAAIDRGNHFLTLKCANVGEFGPHVGFGTGQARDYAAAGHVIEACPGAEQMVLDGAMTIPALAIIAPLLLDDELRPRDKQGKPLSPEAGLRWASLNPDATLRRTVLKRRREVEADEPVAPRLLHLTAQGALDLDRARTLETRRQGRVVSHSAAAEVALREYVLAHDDLEKKTAARRLPPMPQRHDGGRHPRSVPAAVRRELAKRHDDVCAIAYCENKIWLENSHHVPLSEGGGNEIDDQDRICRRHHRLKDHGEIRFVRDDGEPGGGHYVARDGQILPLKPRDLTDAGGGPTTQPDAGKGTDAEGTADGSNPDRVCEATVAIVPVRVEPRSRRARGYPGVHLLTWAEHRRAGCMTMPAA